LNPDYDKKVVFPTPESPSSRMTTVGWLSITVMVQDGKMLHGDVKALSITDRGLSVNFDYCTKLIYFKMSQEDMTLLRHEGLSVELIGQDWPY